MMSPSSSRTAIPMLTCTLALLLSTAPSLLAQAQGSLYGDPKARQAGDVVTVILAEETTAERSSRWEQSSSSDQGVSLNGNGEDVSAAFGADASVSSDSEARNGSIQSDMLRGTFTAEVTDVGPTGNLIISGERRLTLDGETHLMSVDGTVRPHDIRYDNTILSYQIANAEIVYSDGGRKSRWFSPAIFTRTGAVLGVLGAIALIVK